MNVLPSKALCGASLGILSLLSFEGHALACGGFFCDSSVSGIVNQTAERIIFARDDDGGVTQVVEVLYEGEADEFAWILPVVGTPEPGVSSVQAFDRLQARTNPSYNLNVESETCRSRGARGADAQATGFNGADIAGSDNVVVLDSGKVGSFIFDTISVENPDEPAAAALKWLEANGYDVGDLGEAVLEPYLANGLNLIAFRLEKGKSAGAIRPISLYFEPVDGVEPSMTIPIRPTAVAAADNMPVMVWVFGEHRAVPSNYYGLELNELLINWFSVGSNYNSVVTAAANEAGGQGFVTEYASDEHTFSDLFGYQADRASLLRQMDVPDLRDQLVGLIQTFGAYDGMQDVVEETVPLRESVSVLDFLQQPECYFSPQLCWDFEAEHDEWGRIPNDDPIYELDMDEFLTRIVDDVLGPLAQLDTLFDELPYITRLYTTMSADEMSLDPKFEFNPDVETVSNIHTADATRYCDGSFRVELDDGSTVFGSQFGSWPYATSPDPTDDDLPANRRVLSFSSAGSPVVDDDFSSRISDLHLNSAGDPPRGTDAAKDARGCSMGGRPAPPHWPWTLSALSLLSAVTFRRRRTSGK